MNAREQAVVLISSISALLLTNTSVPRSNILNMGLMAGIIGALKLEAPPRVTANQISGAFLFGAIGFAVGRISSECFIQASTCMLGNQMDISTLSILVNSVATATASAKFALNGYRLFSEEANRVVEDYLPADEQGLFRGA